jgi:hypothetical protein
MKVYAYIDQYDSIVSYENKELAPKDAMEFDVEHIGQLQFDNNKNIYIDPSVKSDIMIHRDLQTNAQMTINLRHQILSNIIEQEFVKHGIIESSSMSNDVYCKLLKDYCVRTSSNC